MKRIIAASIALIMASTSLNAQIVVDGTLDATGYTLAATQTNNTSLVTISVNSTPCILDLTALVCMSW